MNERSVAAVGGERRPSAALLRPQQFAVLPHSPLVPPLPLGWWLWRGCERRPMPSSALRSPVPSSAPPLSIDPDILASAKHVLHRPHHALDTAREAAQAGRWVWEKREVLLPLAQLRDQSCDEVASAVAQRSDQVRRVRARSQPVSRVGVHLHFHVPSWTQRRRRSSSSSGGGSCSRRAPSPPSTPGRARCDSSAGEHSLVQRSNPRRHRPAPSDRSVHSRRCPRRASARCRHQAGLYVAVLPLAVTAVTAVTAAVGRDRRDGWGGACRRCSDR